MISSSEESSMMYKENFEESTAELESITETDNEMERDLSNGMQLLTCSLQAFQK